MVVTRGCTEWDCGIWGKVGQQVDRHSQRVGVVSGVVLHWRKTLVQSDAFYISK